MKTKKKTALHAYHSEDRSLLDWRNFIPAGFAFSSLIFCAFVYQIYVLGSEWLNDQNLTHLASKSGQEITRIVETWQNDLDRSAQDLDLVSGFESQDRELIIQTQARLQQNFPGFFRFQLIPPATLKYEPSPYPGLGYGVLDMLMEARRHTNPIPAEIHLYSTDDRHINLVSRVMGTDGRLLALMLLSMPIDEIIQPFQALNIQKGDLQLQQDAKQWHDLTLLTQGVRRTPHEEKTKLTLVDKTALKIQSTPEKLFIPIPTRSFLINGLGVLFAFLSFMLIWTLNKHHKRTIKVLNVPVSNLDAVPAQSLKIPEPKTSERAHSPHQGKAPSPPPSTPSDSTEANTQVENEMISQSIFKAYDIRGIVGETLTRDTAKLIGQAIGSEALSLEQSTIVVGRDGRLSGPEMVSALIEGLQSTGIDVIDIGAVPTGVLYYATYELKTGSGIMVTGSHNPPDYNGFKTMLGGKTLAGEDIQGLYQRIVDQNFETGSGGLQEIDILQDYVDRIADDIQLEEPIKVVVDCGNGIPGIIAPEVLSEIGAEVIPLYCDVDGEFPNHHPDPSVPENLEDLILTVKQMNADLGVAFDGDGDRLGVVTANGEIIYADRLLMMFAQDVLSRNPGETIIYDVKCSSHLSNVILANAGSPLMWKTGHSFIKRKMQEINAPMGGEMSGHFFFKERWYGFDDGIYSAARLLEILSNDGRVAQTIFDELPKSVSTPELKITMKEGETFPFLDKFVANASLTDAQVTTIDGLRADYSDGWGLIRCSNTTPVLVLRFEADNESALKRIQDEFRENLLALDAKLKLPF